MSQPRLKTKTQVAVSQNIRATPPMRPRKVKHDMREVYETGASIVCFQELKWPWYWRALKQVFKKEHWGYHPDHSLKKGAAQCIIWDKRVWKKIASHTRFLHRGEGRIVGTRYINAVLLENRETGLRVWVRNTHYLPGAWIDKNQDEPFRKKMWNAANERDRAHANHLSRTWEEPILSVGDYNRLNYDVLGERINSHQVKYVGEMGVDYTMLIPGDDSHFRVIGQNKLSTRTLFTDHAGRVLRFQLIEEFGKRED